MDRSLNSLDYRFKNVAFEFLARLTEAKLAVMIINTRRTFAEQELALAAGASWVPHSKHQDGLAMDICPFSQYLIHGDSKLQWDSSDPIWQEIGIIGEKLGLGWGGRWKQRDMGHFEWVILSERAHLL